MEVSLLRAIMPFWDVTINKFVFFFGMISPTIYYLLVMFGPSTDGLEFCDNPIVIDSRTQCDISSGNPTTYIQSNKTLGMVTYTEHRAFLLA